MALSEGQKRIYAGAFNVMSQLWQDDGSVIVTIHSHTDSEVITMHMDGLYQVHEEVLHELALPIGPDAHILERQREAHGNQRLPSPGLGPALPQPLPGRPVEDDNLVP